MVRLKKMGQLVNDDVLNHAHRSFDEPLGEIEIVLRSARASAVFKVGDQNVVVATPMWLA